MANIVLETRSGVRALWRGRFVTTLAVMAFALGIGITTAIFSIFNGVLLTPLPYPEPDRLVVVYDTQPALKTAPASFPKYHDWVARNHVFSAIGGAFPQSVVVTGAGDPERLHAARTTASFLDVFRVQPLMGRWYTPEEDRPGGRKVAVLSYGLWVRTFAADPHVLGRTIAIDGDTSEIIGVMPKGFAYSNAELFLPLARALDPSTRGNHFLNVYARLTPGIPLDRAATEMRALGVTLAKEFGTNHGVDVRALREVTVGGIRRPLQLLLGAVLLVLLIACANVANLLLASGLARRRELAIRLALGASPADLARQLTIEGVLLALTGGALGVGLAFWLVRTLVALAGKLLPRATAIGIDGRVLAFSAVVSLAVGIVCGLWPVVRLRTRALAASLNAADTRTGSGGRVGTGLVVAEIAMAFALLIGAGLLAKNLIDLESRDTGFRTDHVIAFDVAPSGPRYDATAQLQAFYRELDQRLAHVAGVDSVGLISHLPMYQYGWNGEMSREGGNPWGPGDAPLVEYRWMYGDYLKAMGIPLLRGRLLDHRDGAGTTTVLINQAMADKFWPGANPIGRRFGQGPDHSRWYRVVGVIGNVRSYGLARPTPFEFYRTTDQDAFPSMTVVMRSSGADPAALIPVARSLVASIDPATPVAGVQTLAGVVAASVGQPRLVSVLTALFGGLAGLLAMVGVYGVMAYNVRRQRREFGIRLALGADPARVRTLVITRSLLLASIGIAIGALAAWLLTGLLRSMLTDVKPTDPTVFAATIVAVLAVSTLAAWLPGRQAARVDPTIVLRDC
ncbi:MAG TPA: ABC transporter permease [Vicinamibacterales bacterium]|nr:ABC transporter permease [Vicinamibacterales bacterium]